MVINKKRTILYIVGYLVVAGAVTGGMMALSLSGNKTSNDLVTAEQDETNSDGQSSSDKQESIVAEDLTAQARVDIDISKSSYSKANIKIKKGAAVAWTNRDVSLHNVMQIHENSNTAHDPPKAIEVVPEVLAGQLLAQGEIYSFMFNKTGTFQYHCAAHPDTQGSVTVVE